METVETMYGTSLGLDIPKLKCKVSEPDTPITLDEVECNSDHAFARESPSMFEIGRAHV